MKTLAFVLFVGLVFGGASHAGPMMGMSGGEEGLQGANTSQRDLLESRNASRKSHALLMLREQALQMRSEDGGTLTPEHHALLQAKLDAIQAGNY